MDMFREAATENQHPNVKTYAELVSAYTQKCLEDVFANKIIMGQIRNHGLPMVIQKLVNSQ